MKRSIIYSLLVVIVFATYTVVFATFERSTYSELEKRELARFPEFTVEKLADGSFTREVSAWFSDSEPYRDVLMTQSMYVKKHFRLNLSDDNVVIHASSNKMQVDDESVDADSLAMVAAADTLQSVDGINADGNAQIANDGIIIVGKGDKVRALMIYGGTPQSGGAYAAAVNKYKETFGDDMNVYCMVVPIAIEFYCPEKVKASTKPQRPTIDNIYGKLSPSIKAVDVHTVLANHVAEDIYLRTDHHWAPLGGYYAAKEFARIAEVPFKSLDAYTQHTVKGFVGSMYGYSKDISVKEAPEDFIYYTPNGVEYATTYITYTIDENYNIADQTEPQRGQYYHHYKDGSGGAYCTFMGGDMKITKVRTSTTNGRRLMVLKDSYGNAVPGYLFFSFEEIHVIDYRYFSYNMKEYVGKNKITDILFVNNVFPVCSGYTARRYLRFLSQPSGIIHVDSAAAADSVRNATDSVIVSKTDSIETVVDSDTILMKSAIVENADNVVINKDSADVKSEE